MCLSLCKIFIKQPFPVSFLAKISVYCNYEKGSSLGFKHPENFIGLDDTAVKAPIVECADLFQKEDKFVFNAQQRYISMGTFNYSDQIRHVFTIKEIIFDPHLKKNIIVVIG